MNNALKLLPHSICFSMWDNIIAYPIPILALQTMIFAF